MVVLMFWYGIVECFLLILPLLSDVCIFVVVPIPMYGFFERIWLLSSVFHGESIAVVVPMSYLVSLNALWCCCLCSCLWANLDHDSWWLFRRLLRYRTHREVKRLDSAFLVNLIQTALVYPVLSPCKSIRHRLGSEPPTGAEDNGSLLVDDTYNFILESSKILFLDDVFDLYKPSFCEGLPHFCNLLQLVGVMLPGGGAGYFSVDFVVIGFP
jgi:hypothetical protein